ncbi:MAG TPA: ROK family transcriptional regulator, partial [Puia sp.]|nr:ROK family transcriptional regulator [Puia sp.]
MQEHNLFDFFTEEISSGVAYKNKLRKREIVNHLDQQGEATISDLSQMLNISPPKTTSLVNELMTDGLLKDYGKIDSSMGRPASTYGLASDACFFLGVDVIQYYISLGLLDFTKTLVTSEMRVPYLLENTSGSLDRLIALIRDFIHRIPIDQKNILSLCISLGGRINTNNGDSHSFFHFSEEPLSSIVQRQLSIRAFLENDSRAMACGEFHKGIVSTEKNVLFLNLDYGLGSGLMIEGKVYYGKSGFSGEIGHIPVFDNEILCHCGKKGCLETEASGRALLRLFKQRIKQGQTSAIVNDPQKLDEIRLTDIIEAARNDDMLSIDLLAEIGGKIGRGIAVLINIFNPEMVILGGTLANTGDYIYLPVRSAIN